MIVESERVYNITITSEEEKVLSECIEVLSKIKNTMCTYHCEDLFNDNDNFCIKSGTFDELIDTLDNLIYTNKMS